MSPEYPNLERYLTGISRRNLWKVLNPLFLLRAALVGGVGGYTGSWLLAFGFVFVLLLVEEVVDRRRPGRSERLKKLVAENSAGALLKALKTGGLEAKLGHAELDSFERCAKQAIEVQMLVFGATMAIPRLPKEHIRTLKQAARSGNSEFLNLLGPTRDRMIFDRWTNEAPPFATAEEDLTRLTEEVRLLVEASKPGWDQPNPTDLAIERLRTLRHAEDELRRDVLDQG